MPAIITITTDFHDDFAVSQLYGTIAGIAPTVQVIPVANDVVPYNIKQGAFIIAEAAAYFPPFAIHVGVIDPGVGTDRRGIIVQTNNGTFIGPDNGLFAPALKHRTITQVISIDRQRVNSRAATTFHGRDIFARAAALLATGVDAATLGTPIPAESLQQLSYQDHEVFYIDPYGNIKVNADPADFPVGTTVTLHCPNGSAKTAGVHKTFGNVPPSTLLCYHGSNGTLEIAVNRGSAAALLDVKLGDVILITN